MSLFVLLIILTSGTLAEAYAFRCRVVAHTAGTYPIGFVLHSAEYSGYYPIVADYPKYCFNAVNQKTNTFSQVFNIQVRPWDTTVWQNVALVYLGKPRVYSTGLLGHGENCYAYKTNGDFYQLIKGGLSVPDCLRKVSRDPDPNPLAWYEGNSGVPMPVIFKAQHVGYTRDPYYIGEIYYKYWAISSANCLADIALNDITPVDYYDPQPTTAQLVVNNAHAGSPIYYDQLSGPNGARYGLGPLGTIPSTYRCGSFIGTYSAGAWTPGAYLLRAYVINPDGAKSYSQALWFYNNGQ